MRISDWSSDVCSSDLLLTRYGWGEIWTRPGFDYRTRRILVLGTMMAIGRWEEFSMHLRAALIDGMSLDDIKEILLQQAIYCGLPVTRSEEHTSELQSLMRISYAVFCCKTKMRRRRDRNEDRSHSQNIKHI